MEADIPASQVYQSEDGDSDDNENNEKLNFYILDEKDDYDMRLRKIESIISYCKIEPNLLFDYLQNLLQSKSK